MTNSKKPKASETRSKSAGPTRRESNERQSTGSNRSESGGPRGRETDGESRGRETGGESRGRETGGESRGRETGGESLGRETGGGSRGRETGGGSRGRETGGASSSNGPESNGGPAPASGKFRGGEGHQGSNDPDYGQMIPNRNNAVGENLSRYFPFTEVSIHAFLAPHK